MREAMSLISYLSNSLPITMKRLKEELSKRWVDNIAHATRMRFEDACRERARIPDAYVTISNSYYENGEQSSRYVVVNNRIEKRYLTIQA